VSAVKDLLHHYQHVIEELTLITGGAGVFEVDVDGVSLFSKKALGRHAHPGEVLELFRGLLGPEVLEYARE
jgi:predicted Rdx family selenoprotein